MRRKIKILIPRGILPGWRKGEPKPKLGTASDYYRHVIERLEATKDPDTELVYKDIPDAIGPHVMQAHEADLVGVLYAREAFEAEKKGFDGVYPTCFAEPGINAARELCTIPVMSSPCAALHVASMLGNKFSIVGCDGRHSKTSLMNLIRRYGMESRLASICLLDVLPTEVNPNLVSKEEYRKIQEKALELAKKAIEQDGAEVIIAYTCYEYLRDNLDVPVIPVRIAGLKMLEAIIRMGLSFSKKTYPKPMYVHTYYLSKRPPNLDKQTQKGGM